MIPERPRELADDAQQRIASHAGRSGESPRLKAPRHHRVVRPHAGRRRLAISLAGVMLLVASALGFVTAAGVLAQAGATQPPALPSQAVEVAGTVTDTTGTPIVNATVEIENGTLGNTTNAEGWYFLGSLAPGTYRLEASKAGYQTVRKSIVLSPAFPREVDFALPAGNGTIDGPSDRQPTYADPTTGVYVLAGAVAVCSALAGLGGVSALFHRHYLIAVAGAAAGVLTFGYFVGPALSIAALAILGSLKTGFLEAEHHRVPWEGKIGPPVEPPKRPR